MEQKEQIRSVRSLCNTAGFSALGYYAIMNVAVMLALIFDMILYVVKNLQTFDMNAMMEYVSQSVLSNGWGYLLATLIGALIVWLWKKKAFWVNEVFASRKKMTPVSFLMILAVFVAVQAILQLIAPVMEWLFNLLGFSVMAAMEAASMTADTVSMFLYLAIFAPLAEELLFRGLLLRVLEPAGKQFAILASSLLFALLHGNVIQIPFAFLVGLVLGYVTVEYSIVWAIVLHIFNNFVLSDSLNRLNGLIPGAGDTVFLIVLILAAIGAVITLILRRKEIAAFFRENPVEKTSIKGFFTSPGILIFGILMLLMSLLSITKL